MVTFGTRNVSNFHFHFLGLFSQNLIRLGQIRHSLMQPITKMSLKIDLLLPQNSSFQFQLRYSVTKVLKPIAFSTFSSVWRCDYVWVDSSCHSGSLYLRHNIELGEGDIRIGTYCTLSNVSKKSTGFDQISIE